MSNNREARRRKAVRRRERERMREKCNAIVSKPRPAKSQPLHLARWLAAQTWLSYDRQGAHEEAEMISKLMSLAPYDAIRSRRWKDETYQAAAMERYRKRS